MGNLCSVGTVSVLQDEKRMDVGDGRTSVWMYLMPLNCTLKNGKFILCVFYHN